MMVHDSPRSTRHVDSIEIDAASSTVNTPACSGLPLCNDIVFKALFSRHLHLLSDLINAIRRPAEPIRVERILNPHILPQDLDGKHVILDILAQDAQGRRFGIEMQLQRYLHWPQRNVYVLARSLADQLQSGQDYRSLSPVIGISLLAHDLFLDKPDTALWRFTLRDDLNHGVQLGDALQVHIIELNKAESLGGLPRPLSDWIACVRHNLDEVAMSHITHPPVKQALEQLQGLYSDEELRMAAVRREQALVDAQDALDWAEHHGRQEGRQEGGMAILSGLLERRFGPVPPRYRAVLEKASAAELQQWSLRLFDAKTIEQVFTV